MRALHGWPLGSSSRHGGARRGVTIIGLEHVLNVELPDRHDDACEEGRRECQSKKPHAAPKTSCVTITSAGGRCTARFSMEGVSRQLAKMTESSGLVLDRGYTVLRGVAIVGGLIRYNGALRNTERTLHARARIRLVGPDAVFDRIRAAFSDVVRFSPVPPAGDMKERDGHSGARTDGTGSGSAPAFRRPSSWRRRSTSSGITARAAMDGPRTTGTRSPKAWSITGAAYPSSSGALCSTRR
jgi:hypothetical protein